ncbi:MAG: hypothetical protein KJ064_02325 [Anaerolineae bacterium]|nr:hypothetical protein [Anaerolineae bacterium]
MENDDPVIVSKLPEEEILHLIDEMLQEIRHLAEHPELPQQQWIGKSEQWLFTLEIAKSMLQGNE